MPARSNRLLVAAGATAATVAGIWAVTRARQRSADPATRDRESYPPREMPKSIAADVWIVDGGPMIAMGLHLPIRMTIFRLPNGDLLLHSPIEYSPELGDRVAALGTVRHLVAPNIAHWTFTAAWQQAYPETTVWGVPGLRDKAQVKASDLRIDADLGDVAPPAWDGVINQGIIAGAGGFTEAWFFHRPTRTLVLVDLIENLEPDKLPPVTRLVMQASAATRGTTATYLRLPVRFGGEDAKQAVRALATLDPERVVFAHGRIFDTDGAARLKRAFAWLK